MKLHFLLFHGFPKKKVHMPVVQPVNNQKHFKEIGAKFYFSQKFQ